MESKKEKNIEINSKGLSFTQGLQELIRYKSLISTFAWRDYKSKYAQTKLGYFWAVFQPIVSVLILFILFKKFAKIGPEGVDYISYALSGLILWNYFQNTILQSASSLISSQRMIQKIYFPKMSLPLSKALVGLIEMGIGLLLLSIYLAYKGEFSFLALLAFPLPLFVCGISAIGIGLFSSALSIRFRDLQQVLPFILQSVFFLSPIAYSSQILESSISSSLNWVLYLNPIYGSIEFFRHFLIGSDLNPLSIVSLLSAVLILFCGFFFFKRAETYMADYL